MRVMISPVVSSFVVLSSISVAACPGVSVRLTVSEVTSTIVAVSGSLFTAVVSSGIFSVLGGAIVPASEEGSGIISSIGGKGSTSSVHSQALAGVFS